ncbi:hypothetical protein PHMEG_00026993 [Phytophthora megakarya]|uniref:Uncharacterized protein n=1 Tax=Phytophthora megakarya TaxID=4795 RepID=A0A225V887_9STRA|nr:hypothetical protein PHMEG_00026993 [Phytophthora megakarya]
MIIEDVNTVMEPQTVKKVLVAPDAVVWIEILEKEHMDLMRNGTWEQVKRPMDK